MTTAVPVTHAKRAGFLQGFRRGLWRAEVAFYLTAHPGGLTRSERAEIAERMARRHFDGVRRPPCALDAMLRDLSKGRL